MEAEKIKLTNILDSNEYALLFLRPSPPKMMVKNSVIKRNLFPLYESVLPLNYQDNQNNEVIFFNSILMLVNVSYQNFEIKQYYLK